MPRWAPTTTEECCALLSEDDPAPLTSSQVVAGATTRELQYPKETKLPETRNGGPGSSTDARGQPRLEPVGSRSTGSIRCARDAVLEADAKTILENILKQTRAHTRSHNAVLKTGHRSHITSLHTTERIKLPTRRYWGRILAGLERQKMGNWTYRNVLTNRTRTLGLWRPVWREAAELFYGSAYAPTHIST